MVELLDIETKLYLLPFDIPEQVGGSPTPYSTLPMVVTKRETDLPHGLPNQPKTGFHFVPLPDAGCLGVIDPVGLIALPTVRSMGLIMARRDIVGTEILGECVYVGDQDCNIDLIPLDDDIVEFMTAPGWDREDIGIGDYFTSPDMRRNSIDVGQYLGQFHVRDMFEPSHWEGEIDVRHLVQCHGNDQYALIRDMPVDYRRVPGAARPAWSYVNEDRTILLSSLPEAPGFIQGPPGYDGPNLSVLKDGRRVLMPSMNVSGFLRPDHAFEVIGDYGPDMRLGPMLETDGCKALHSVGFHQDTGVSRIRLLLDDSRPF